MVSEEIALQAMTLLSTAIAELFEDADPADISALQGAGAGDRAAALGDLGRDVAGLAAAIEILARCSRWPSAGSEGVDP